MSLEVWGYFMWWLYRIIEKIVNAFVQIELCHMKNACDSYPQMSLFVRWNNNLKNTHFSVTWWTFPISLQFQTTKYKLLCIWSFWQNL